MYVRKLSKFILYCTTLAYITLTNPLLANSQVHNLNSSTTKPPAQNTIDSKVNIPGLKITLEEVNGKKVIKFRSDITTIITDIEKLPLFPDDYLDKRDDQEFQIMY